MSNKYNDGHSQIRLQMLNLKLELKYLVFHEFLSEVSLSCLTLQLINNNLCFNNTYIPWFYECSNQWLKVVCPMNHFEASG